MEKLNITTTSFKLRDYVVDIVSDDSDGTKDIWIGKEDGAMKLYCFGLTGTIDEVQRKVADMLLSDDKYFGGLEEVDIFGREDKED